MDSGATQRAELVTDFRSCWIAPSSFWISAGTSIAINTRIKISLELAEPYRARLVKLASECVVCHLEKKNGDGRFPREKLLRCVQYRLAFRGIPRQDLQFL